VQRSLLSTLSATPVNNPESDDAEVNKLLIQNGEEEPSEQIEFVRQMKQYWDSQ
jgi:hypothetical protein